MEEKRGGTKKGGDDRTPAEQKRGYWLGSARASLSFPDLRGRSSRKMGGRQRPPG